MTTSRTTARPAVIHPAVPTARGRHDRALALVRIAFGLAWAADAALKWLPAFRDTTFLSTLRAARTGQPAAVTTWINAWIDLFSPHPEVWAYTLAVTESIIAICLIAGAFTNLICLLGALLSLGIWTTAEGLGGPYTKGSTDISASIIYVIVFAALAATSAGCTWGVDRWLRPRLGRWRWLSSQPTSSRSAVA